MVSPSPIMVRRDAEASAIGKVNFCGCGKIAPGNQLRDNTIYGQGVYRLRLYL